MRGRDVHPAERELAALATTQHGVVAFGQLLALGVSRASIERRVRSGRLHPLHREVFAVGHRAVPGEGRWLAATLALGEGAVLSHTSAAALWGLRPSAGAAIHVTVPRIGGRARRAGLSVHRTRRLSNTETTTRGPIAVTTPARTLLDLAERLPQSDVDRAVDEAERLRLFDLVAVDAVLAANPGRRGATRLRRAVILHRPDARATRSELESRFLELCRREGLPSPRVNTLLHGLEVDFHWPHAALVAEVDGHAAHGTRAAFERDRARDVELATRGLRVVRFTYHQLTGDARAVAGALRLLLRPPAGPGPGPG